MVNRSVAFEVGGRKFRLYYGYGAQKRMGCTRGLDLLLRLHSLYIRRQGGPVIDVDLGVLRDLIRGGLHQPDSPDGRRLLPAEVDGDAIDALLEAEIEAGLDAGRSQAETLGAIVRQVEHAIGEANIVPTGDDQPAQDKEAAEEPADPTLADENPSGLSSAAQPRAA